MAAVLAVVFGLIALGLALRVYTAERAIRDAAWQLKEAGAAGSAGKLRLAVPNSSAEELIAAINGLLALRTADEASFRRRETALRRQIANASHDLRTPLTSILGYLQLLEGETLSAEERLEYLGIVESRAKALQGLITSFYDLSRLDGGEYPLVREKIDLGAVLSELAASFYNDLIDSGLAVQVDLAEGLPLVWGDSSAALRIFTNLIRNALDHGRGTLSIRAYREGSEVVTAFQNGAEGLTEEIVGHVFDRSFTSDRNRTDQNAGLGLAIVKALAEQMEGRAEAVLEGGLFTLSVRWKI